LSRFIQSIRFAQPQAAAAEPQFIAENVISKAGDDSHPTFKSDSKIDKGPTRGKETVQKTGESNEIFKGGTGEKQKAVE